jgi:alpha/beta superfamily hydrolase
LTVSRRIESHFLAGPAGRLEALVEEPEDGAAHSAVLVCHPHPLYGGTMHNKVVFRIARGLRRAGLVVLRFNFRGVGRSQGEYAQIAGEIEDARAALGWLRQRYQGLPFALAGFSFGAQVITRLGCALEGARFLMAVGHPTERGNDYLEDCPVPKIFVQSTHDEFGPRPQLETLYAKLVQPKQLIWVEAADHFFAGGLDELEQAVKSSVEAVAAGEMDKRWA